MNKPDYQDELNEFANKLLNLTEEFQNSLPPYEIVNRMIAHAVSMSLCCAPNELLGVKTIMASVGIGINEYEQNHS